MRIALATLAAILGYQSVAFSIAQVVARGDPEMAHRMAPYDGRITATLSAALSMPKATSAERTRSDELAKLALRQDPTAVAAVATLGVNADLRGKTDEARRLFTYAQKLSRRDLRTQLWLIEDAVRRDDIPSALRHYDITLRVFPLMAELLYPVLAAASDDPAIQPALIKIMAGKPNWTESFINFVVVNGASPQSNAALIEGLRRAGVTVPVSAQTEVINRLLASGQSDAAWAYYAAIRPGVDRRRSRDTRFTAQIETPSSLDWVPVNDGGVTTSILPGLFDFAAPASVGGPLLQQRQLLPPGTYQLIGHSVGIEQSESARPYWTLRCADGRELGRVALPNSSDADGEFSGSFTVPAECPAQTLMLVARASNVVSGQSGQIDRIELVRIEAEIGAA